MRPDDIINAIGEVDERFVRRAHRKDRLKSILAFILTLAISMLALSMTMEPDYVLSRYTPDLTPNNGYVDPTHLEDDHWTTMTHTSFRNGSEAAVTKFSRTLFNHYSAERTESDGSHTKLFGEIQGEYYRNEYLGSKSEQNLYTSCFYEKDLIGRLNHMVVHTESAHADGYALLNMLEFEYFENQFLVEQRKVTDTELLGYRTLDYTNHRISKTKDYDSEDNLISYTEYAYDGQTLTTKSYTADDVLTGSAIAKYDWLGRILSKESYDSEGALISREEYHYRIWELFYSIEGAICLIGILFLAMAIGKGIYDDRIHFPTKK